MATQARAMPASMARNNNKSPGIIGQIKALIIQPAAFFHGMPQSRQWWLVAVLILVIFGFAAANQTQSDITVSATQNAQGFDLNMLQTDAAMAESGLSTTTTQSTNDSTGTNSTLTAGLLAACGVLVMWSGQAGLLCLIPMLHGHSPNIGRSLQIVVWASLPLALMLGLRQIYFATGGTTGGAIGLSLLLDQWEGYTTLPEVVQRVLAVFMSNLSLFWVWSMALLYFGTRYALSGKRWSVVLVMVMWIAASTVIPALISEPVTTTAPRTTTTVEQTSTSSESSNSNTQQANMGMGGMMGGQGGGMPPSGGGGPSGGPGGGPPGG